LRLANFIGGTFCPPAGGGVRSDGSDCAAAALALDASAETINAIEDVPRMNAVV